MPDRIADGVAVQPAARTSVPHRGLLSRVEAHGLFYLAHAGTQELVAPKQPGHTDCGSFELDFDDDGDGYLVWADDSTTWASQHLQLQLHRTAGKDFIAQGGKRWWASEFFARHTLCRVGLRTIEHRRQVNMEVSRFECSRIGVVLWWSWASVWDFAGFKFEAAWMSVSRWVLKRWTAWEKWLSETMGLQPPTLRRARPYATATDEDTRDRVLSFQSVATPGLVALLGRMCFGDEIRGGGMTDPDNRNAASRTLRSVLQRLDHIGRIEFKIILDHKAEWRAPAPPSGSDHALALPMVVEFGRVMLAGGLEHTGVPDAARGAAAPATGVLQQWVLLVSRVSGAESGGSRIFDFLEALWPAPILCKQVLWHLSRRLDSEIAQEWRPDGQSSLMRLSVKDDVALRLTATEGNICDETVRGQEMRLLRYWLAGHTWGCQGQGPGSKPRFPHISPQGSCVSERARGDPRAPTIAGGAWLQRRPSA